MSRKTTPTRPTLRLLTWAVLLCAVLIGSALGSGGAQQARAAGPEPILPNLVADPPDNISLATDSSTGVNRLLLRFNGYVHNKGPGTLDFRGSREKPKVSKQVEEEVERAREKQETLPQKVEEELAVPPMKVFQRLFTTNTEETNSERPHVEEPSSGEMIYVNADGHHHWHLQRVAKYSLWNATKTAEVAPASKVGFCLEDSQHVEPSIGPATPVYADNVPPYRDFCQQYRPNATGLFEGISPGWRDVYSHELAFQWVDASNVLPGEYWLREDVNPLSVIKETGGANVPAYATAPTIIPGFDALAQTTGMQTGEAKTIGLTAKGWSDSATPKYTIVSQPQHGKLGAITNNNLVTYTPNPGYVGTDSFTFSAADPNSQFPLSPAVATISIEVTAPTTRTLLVGSAASTYTVGDQTTVGREEAFQFTAGSSGTVEELQFHTNATANPGVTGVALGVFSESAGKPGEVLGQVTAWGEPPVSSWLKASGLSVPVVSGTKYWLVLLPFGESGKKLHYNAAVASGGSGNQETVAGGMTSLTAQSAWDTYNQGPVGFQALGRNTTQPSVTIVGAPASMVAGTSVQLSATVLNDSPTVTWKASAGTITTAGLYTAPATPPAGGKVVITATSSKGAMDQRSIEITPLRVVLVGSGTSTYTVGDQTTVGREEAFQFTAGATGTVEELQLRTNATANPGVTAVALGVFAENGGKPGEVLGGATALGEPQVDSWLKASGLSVPVVSGTKYWLVLLPLGEAGKKIHYNVAVAAGGTGNVETMAGGMGSLTAQSTWETYNQGPIGFQALGAGSAGAASVVLSAAASAPRSAGSAHTSISAHARTATAAPRTLADGTASLARATSEPPPPPSRVAIAGAQATIVAGASVQLSALVSGGEQDVKWSASAGTVTNSGLFTAPTAPPQGEHVTLTADVPGGVSDRRVIAIVSVPAPAPAPSAPLGEGAASTLAASASRAGGSALAKTNSHPAVLPPEAMLVGHTLVMTAVATAGGQITLTADLHGRRLGHCTIHTPADRGFTCQLALAKSVSATAPIEVSASLSAGGVTLRSTRSGAPVAEMRMGGAFGADANELVIGGHVVHIDGRRLPASLLSCSPSLARPAKPAS